MRLSDCTQSCVSTQGDCTLLRSNNRAMYELATKIALRDVMGCSFDLKSSFEFFNLNSSWSIYRKIYAFSGSSRISKILFRQQKTHSLTTVGFYFGGV
jgi:hypothetical protein